MWFRSRGNLWFYWGLCSGLGFRLGRNFRFQQRLGPDLLRRGGLWRRRHWFDRRLRRGGQRDILRQHLHLLRLDDVGLQVRVVLYGPHDADVLTGAGREVYFPRGALYVGANGAGSGVADDESLRAGRPAGIDRACSQEAFRGVDYLLCRGALDLQVLALQLVQLPLGRRALDQCLEDLMIFLPPHRGLDIIHAVLDVRLPLAIGRKANRFVFVDQGFEVTSTRGLLEFGDDSGLQLAEGLGHLFFGEGFLYRGCSSRLCRRLDGRLRRWPSGRLLARFIRLAGWCGFGRRPAFGGGLCCLPERFDVTVGDPKIHAFRRGDLIVLLDGAEDLHLLAELQLLLQRPETALAMCTAGTDPDIGTCHHTGLAVLVRPDVPLGDDAKGTLRWENLQPAGNLAHDSHAGWLGQSRARIGRHLGVPSNVDVRSGHHTDILTVLLTSRWGCLGL